MVRCLLCGTTSGARTTLERIARRETHWFRGPGYKPTVQAHLLRREGKVMRVAAPPPLYSQWVLTALGEAALACAHRWPTTPPSAAVRRGEPRGKLARVVAVVPTEIEVPGRVGRSWPTAAAATHAPDPGDIHAFLREAPWRR